MKFSDLSPQQWAELQPYLDTAVIPYTGLSGGEMPYEATEALEKLRDVLDLIEIPFKGRIVTYPANHYGAWDSGGIAQAAAMSLKLKQCGFKFIVIVAAFSVEEGAASQVNADLIISLQQDGAMPEGSEVNDAVRMMWLGR